MKYKYTYIIILLISCIYYSDLMTIQIFSYENDKNTTLKILGQTVYDEQANKENEEQIKSNLSKTEISKSEKILTRSSLELKKLQLMQKILELESRR